MTSKTAKRLDSLSRKTATSTRKMMQILSELPSAPSPDDFPAIGDPLYEKIMAFYRNCLAEERRDHKRQEFAQILAAMEGFIHAQSSFDKAHAALCRAM